ncbi:hypothetical protein AMTR_s00080p00046380 [Amborella trichopoda]|uniref:Uncharacterized protein n=1 Tax=Amborella trichopoda TaxID=13333 RepID=W1PB19_AMBTC|nr:hypothetical protein AMTR_s00080p00046380 [Amborella trichopoda]
MGFEGYFASVRGFRKLRRRPQARKQSPKEKKLELNVRICVEEELPDDPEVLSTAEMLLLKVPMAMKIAFDGLKDSEYKTRDKAIDDVGGFERVELSVLLCNDDFIRKLNKEWRDEDHATDVLSMSQHILGFDLPILMLGDIVISVETAARQAEERGHTLLDEIHILLVHGLLHLLGFDHELSDEAEAEMEKDEELILKSLGLGTSNWLRFVLPFHLRHKKLPMKMAVRDFFAGTLLNNKSRVTHRTAEALKEVVSRGVKVVTATGMVYSLKLGNKDYTRPAVINALKLVNLAGKDGIISQFSPGVFLQIISMLPFTELHGSVDILKPVLGGKVVKPHNEKAMMMTMMMILALQCLPYISIGTAILDTLLCTSMAFLYSLEHKVPLIGFSQDRCVTLFDYPLIDSLHTVYFEPKAEVIPSVEQLLATVDIQKLIFIDTTEGVAATLRPYWAEVVKGRAGVVQAQADMLEVVPPSTSKGDGVRMLLDHLGITPKEVMAIGDGENDVEMLQLASLGVALENGSEKAKAIADVIGNSNSEEGMADAIYRFVFYQENSQSHTIAKFNVDL